MPFPAQGRASPCAGGFAALALDVLQAVGGRKVWQGLTVPLFAWLAAGSYLHTPSDLIPARSLQTARGAHWSPLPCGSRPLLWAQSARESPFWETLNPEPRAGAPKAQPPARVVPHCTSKCLWLL